MNFITSRRGRSVRVAFAAVAAVSSSEALAQTTPAAPEAPVIRPYVLIKPTVIFAAKAVESFGQPNAVAATAAANPVLAALPDEAFLTFQAVQSRAGVWFDEKGPVRGHLEIDFVDFAKSSPTTGSLPRLRIAALEWKLDDSLLLSAGQDWDLYAPVNPHSFNIVAVAFQAGNTAFMRQQIKLIHTGERLELGMALGMSGINNGARIAVPEFNQLPSLALRASLLMGAAGRIGVSAIGSRWRFAPGANAERSAFAGAANVFGDITPTKNLGVRFEAYAGRNLANMGSLSLGNGNNDNDIDEFGGFVSARLGLTDSHAVYALAGFAQVVNDEDVLPSYGYPGAMPGMSGAAAASGTGPGILWNRTARLGYEYRHSKSVAVLLEGFAYQTRHQLDAQFDVGRIDDERSAYGGEFGFMFSL